VSGIQARVRQGFARASPVINNGWVRATVLLLTAAVSVWSIGRVPDNASVLPALFGLVPFAAGKYLLCPLRWHGLAASGQGRWWHIRAYAESELLGLLSPAHAGADLWRVHRLHGTGMSRTAAVAGVALDRMVGAVALTMAVLLTGILLPPRLLIAMLVIAVAVVIIALVVRLRRPDLLVERPLPRPWALARGLLLSLAYQATVVGLVFGAVTAVGHQVDLLRLLAVFGASQVAAIIPGINGASPRDGALAVGFTTLGLSWTTSLAAVALIAVMPWVPALLLGGGSFALRRLRTPAPALRPPPVPAPALPALPALSAAPHG
jgi:hypothetical protein